MVDLQGVGNDEIALAPDGSHGLDLGNTSLHVLADELIIARLVGHMLARLLVVGGRRRLDGHLLLDGSFLLRKEAHGGSDWRAARGLVEWW